MAHQLSLEVRPIAGSDIDQAAESAFQLALKLNVAVEFNFNGIRCYVTEHSRPREIGQCYRVAAARGMKDIYAALALSERQRLEIIETEKARWQERVVQPASECHAKERSDA